MQGHFSNSVSLEPDIGRLEVVASVCGEEATNAPDSNKTYPLHIVFDGLLAFRFVELDSWESQYSFSDEGSNFDEVIGSEWLRSFIPGGKVRPDHRHFSLQTYDYVMDVICARYEIYMTIE